MANTCSSGTLDIFRKCKQIPQIPSRRPPHQPNLLRVWFCGRIRRIIRCLEQFIRYMAELWVWRGTSRPLHRHRIGACKQIASATATQSCRSHEDSAVAIAVEQPRIIQDVEGARPAIDVSWYLYDAVMFKGMKRQMLSRQSPLNAASHG